MIGFATDCLVVASVIGFVFLNLLAALNRWLEQEEQW